MADDYGGILGAFPYAFRRSDSLLFRSYVLVAGLTTLLLALACVLAIVVVFGQTAGARGGNFTLSRSFIALLGLLAVLPVVGPVLLAARTRRRGLADDGAFEPPRNYEPLLAVAGYLFLLALYLGLVASMPETFTLDGETITRPAPSGPFAPVLAALYAVPPIASPLIPAAAAAAILAVHRWRR
ncbi:MULTISPECIES: hypothetical protein [Halolamina]|uniref:DUF8056 domain-containing protein n=1 Tax=Halolamina pelagica TaxID=699431 RepID=A0A1I5VHM0_9EURY|nr:MULTISPECIES: hypothetical protein [Halolamina]NHX37665.1 hypothetical protein [Halolamina sp. R1-12]SFQ06979.1 hypothetical protein SAMN05216277_1189 [Halolamina pelagica]